MLRRILSIIFGSVKALFLTFRALFLFIVITLIAIPTAIFIALSLPQVQDQIRDICEAEFSQLTGAEVSIADLSIRPFNRAIMRGVAVVADGDTILKARRLGAGISVYELMVNGRLAFNYVELIGGDLRLKRARPGDPLNVQPIIDRLANKDPQKKPADFDVRINTVVVRQTSLSYDVVSEPFIQSRFDKNHISIRDFQTDINIPSLSSESYLVNLRRLALEEQSGFRIDNVQAEVSVTPEALQWKSVEISMPRSAVRLADGGLSLDGVESIPVKVATEGIDFNIASGSHVYLPALAMFVPTLEGLDLTIDLRAEGNVNPDRITIRQLNLNDGRGNLSVDMVHGSLSSYRHIEDMEFSLGKVSINVGGDFTAMLQRRGMLGDRMPSLPGTLTLEATGHGSALGGSVDLKARSDDSSVEAMASYSRSDLHKPLSIEGEVKVDNLDLRTLLHNNDFGIVNAEAKGRGRFGYGAPAFDIELSATDVAFRRHIYDRLSASAGYDDGSFEGQVLMYDDAGDIFLSFDGSNVKGEERLNLEGSLRAVNLYAMNLIDKYENFTLSCNIMAELDGKLPDRADGLVSVEHIVVAKPGGSHLDLGTIDLTSRCSELPRTITVDSPIANGTISGDFTFKTLPDRIIALAMSPFDEREQAETNEAHLTDEISRKQTEGNCFNIDLTVNTTEKLSQFFDWPFAIIYPMKIDGNFDDAASHANMSIDAPYLLQGNRVLENARINISLDGSQNADLFDFTLDMPTKQGMMTMRVDAGAKDKRVDADIAWHVDSPRKYEGELKFVADLISDGERKLMADVEVEPSQVAINDSVWDIGRGKIRVNSAQDIIVDNLSAERRNQYVRINGKVSPSVDDKLVVDVLNLDLDYVFESLAIDAVMLGGEATGKIEGSALLSHQPRLLTEGIYVKNISYNKCWFGDAVVTSHWDLDRKAVALDGTIMQPGGKVSKVEGMIFPLTSSLDIEFIADDAPLGFMGKYMSAFASDVTGHGTGRARLYGTFHDIDMEGQLRVDDLRLRLNFTNTYYTASDSVTIVPGKIKLTDVLLHDAYGHTALLNGEVSHKYFRDPTFNFKISDARNLLVYDESAKANPDWYGRIFVNGEASVIGVPGMVDIDVNATTADGSMFTFVLSELEVADEYTFLTFRDKDKLAVMEDEEMQDRNMGLVKRFKALTANNEEGGSTDYVIKLRVNITSTAEIDLVMDPVGGDKIRSHGRGDIRMVYASKDNKLDMFGTYTLERGTYNFTLQDIIIRDFTISEGSSIRFDGDPLKALLSIQAVYSVNANLSDLDESFLQDRDLTRTNVPVHALLMVDGSIQAPSISFDLSFPTLTSDVYRKVRSIISTEEMMTRQIIYLLALNRFYTPEYMASTTKGNELFSVASSTITSQLGNMLGHLSDNWAISPNLRSDRGDFSDMEVDVGLSSRLLNNRLLLNGNLGYRDKSLNSNQFVGYFDIEYLLNRGGSVRLKAYSHYNDENYYVRTAATTQGVGIAFKRDFDNIFSFLNRMRRQKDESEYKSKSGSGSKKRDEAVKIEKDRQPYVPDSVASPADSLLIFR